jgi:hypothetical protein
LHVQSPNGRVRSPNEIDNFADNSSLGRGGSKCYLSPPFSLARRSPCAMRLPLFAAVALAAVLASGCRTRPEQRAMFESYQEEARRLEARIYDLEYNNMVLCDENERLKKRLEKLALDKPERVDDGPRVFPRSTPRTGSSTEPDIDLTPPEIDLGPPSNPGGTNKPVTPEAETALPDVDSPPGESSPEPPSDDPPDEPPPRPASILNRPGAETLPAPKPGEKRKNSELLPAPEEKKVSQLSFQWYSNGTGSGTSGVVQPAENRWTPRPAQRRKLAE